MKIGVSGGGMGVKGHVEGWLGTSPFHSGVPPQTMPLYVNIHACFIRSLISFLSDQERGVVVKSNIKWRSAVRFKIMTNVTVFGLCLKQQSK